MTLSPLSKRLTFHNSNHVSCVLKISHTVLGGKTNSRNCLLVIVGNETPVNGHGMGGVEASGNTHPYLVGGEEQESGISQFQKSQGR